MLHRLFKPKNPLRGGDPAEGRLRAAPGRSLLAPHDGLVATIRSLVGVPATHWDRLYQPLLEAFAELVQLLPASEAHHHAGLGGLLRHSLEVVHEALRLRRSTLLPQGAAAEELARLQDLLTYACVTGALLHDVGKPAVDQHIQMFDAQGKPAGAWSPLGGPMREGTAYEVTFNRKRSYRRHERIAPLLVSLIVPPAGLRWLASEATILDPWLAAIQGDMDAAGPLGVIIGKADGLSVAHNVSGGVNVQMPTARAKPLSDRLIAGLRHLITSEALPLNRPGAAGFVTGDTLWLVSKRVLDALREHLIQEGQSGVPTRNDRLMDELQQQGLITPHGDRAVWNCEIQIGGWGQQLSCLRMEASRIWPDPDQQPEPLAGNVTPLDVVDADQPANPIKIPNSAPLERTEVAAQGQLEVELASFVPPPSPGEPSWHPASSGLPMPFDIDEQPTPFNEDMNAETAPSAHAATAFSAPAATPTAAPTVLDTDAETADSTTDLGERFVEWLRQNIIQRRVEINTPKARLHVLPQGLALVSPGIFRDFDPVKWNQVQKRFQKLKRHRKTPGDMNIWTCRVAKDRKQSLIKVFLIDDPLAVLSIAELPPPNEAVTLMENDTNEEANP